MLLCRAIRVPLTLALVACFALTACTGGSNGRHRADTESFDVNKMHTIKAPNAGVNDHFGFALALSGDGNTLAVSSPGESGNAMVAGGIPDRHPATIGSGAVYVFTRVGGTWRQPVHLKASNPSHGDQFGYSIALSDDGNTLAVGAAFEDSTGTGINGHQGSIAENSANRGAVYIFSRSGGHWSQQAYVKSDAGHDNAFFGGAVTLSGDGNTLVVGAIGERTGGMDAGAVYVFSRSAGTWSQQSFLQPSNSRPGAHFGFAVKLNSDGDLLAVGAPDEYSGDNTGGAVYLFARAADAWTQQALLKASNTAALDNFGSSIALNRDGTTLAVGSGAVDVFIRDKTHWSRQANMKAPDARSNERVGANAVALSSDGNMLAVGAVGDDAAGAVYYFIRRADSWLQQSRSKVSGSVAGDLRGHAISLNSDGNVLAVGAPGESSGAIGAGAVYLY